VRLLLVEDDARLARMLMRGLSEEGFAVEWSRDGVRGAEELRGRPYDVCVLDVMLPGIDGFGVLEQARGANVKTPVLMLTARDAVRDRVRGLEGGADDYLVKPFAFAELLARLHALLRRQPPSDRSTLRWRDVELDTSAHRVTRAGTAIDLSQKQFALLEFLLRHPDEVVSRGMILESVFGYTFDPGTNLVDVHVAHLRQKIDRPGEESIIETVRGVGYRLSGG
jgi:DNA-binding response OmpR family regulator